MYYADQGFKMKPLVGHMVQDKEKVTEEPAVKRIQIQLKKAPKVSNADTDSEDSDDEKEEPVKKVKPTGSAKGKATKSPEFVEINSEDSGDPGVEDTPRVTPVSLLLDP